MCRGSLRILVEKTACGRLKKGENEREYSGERLTGSLRQ